MTKHQLNQAWYMAFSIDPSGASILLGDKTLLENIDFIVYQTDKELRIGGSNIISEDNEAYNNADGGGAFTGLKRKFKLDWVDSKGRRWDFAHAVLDMRVYEDFFAFHTACDVEASLKEDGHFRVEIDSLPGLTKLLGLHMYSNWWSRPHFDTDLANLPLRTQMLLWKLESGEYAALVPVVDGGSRAQLNGRTGKLGCDQLLLDYGHNNAAGLSFVGGSGQDPYRLIEFLISKAFAICGHQGRMRQEKTYPDFFEKIGWCTWNAMYQKVNEKDILQKMEEVQNDAFPFGYTLIDDGWSPLIDHQLADFEVDREKFPSGFKALVDIIKQKYAIQKVGVWHTFTGYWRGVHPQGNAYKQTSEYILDTKRNTHIPYPESVKSFGFWNTFHSWLKTQNIDFVKVDNQGATYQHTLGTMPIGEASKGQQYGLQASAGLNFNNGIVNCMCMSGENIWHWTQSNIARNSDDFFPDNIPSGCEHARQNIYNNLFYGNFAWPDWDMFWSYHELGKYHAAMRAVSGGPVYVTDEVGKADYSVLWPLILNDGTLLRCDFPSLPTRDSLFADPQHHPVLIKSFNRTGASGVLLAINATDEKTTVHGAIRPSDVEGLRGERFAVREFFTGEERLLDFSEEWEVDIAPFGFLLFTIVPVIDGTGVIGLSDKYVSAAALDACVPCEDGISIVLKQGGALSLYTDHSIKRVTLGESELKFRQEGGWMEAEIPGASSVSLCVEFRT